jgi:hypothetical protein
MIFDFLVCSPKDHFVWVKFLMGLVNLLSSPKIHAIKIHFFYRNAKNTNDFFLLNIVFNKKLNYSKDIFFMILFFFLRKA